MRLNDGVGPKCGSRPRSRREARRLFSSCLRSGSARITIERLDDPAGGVSVQQFVGRHAGQCRTGDDARSTEPSRGASESRAEVNASRGSHSRNPGSLRDSLDLPNLWLESAPCPSVSGPVRGGAVVVFTLFPRRETQNQRNSGNSTTNQTRKQPAAHTSPAPVGGFSVDAGSRLISST